MDTKVWDVRDYQQNLNQYENLDEIKLTFERGGLVALPTETVYGLGADARNALAVENIYKAKGRPSDNPLIVHIHHRRQLEDFTEPINDKVELLMEELWPGPISFIVPLKRGFLCERVSGGLSSIAVRMPSHSIGRQLLQYVDMPIAAPSANLSGKPSPTTFQHVYKDLNGRVDGIVNGDQSEEGLESTVLDCTQYPFKIARPGAITKAMIEKIIPNCVDDQEILDNEKPIAPGMKYKHYAPETPLTIIYSFDDLDNESSKWNNSAFIVPDDKQNLVPKQAQVISLCQNEEDIKTANHNLYHILHDIDTNDAVHHAYIYGFEKRDDTMAIMNRMEKAASHYLGKGGNV